MVVTRATRNRFVGVEPARGYESHRLRQGQIAAAICFLFSTDKQEIRTLNIVLRFYFYPFC